MSGQAPDGPDAPDGLEGATALVGVIGGVGPLATALFLEAVVLLTEAGRDQDHVDMVVLQHASIPDRTAHVLGLSQEDPGPVMAQDARRLERWGAAFVVVPCNTAQHYVDQITAAVAIPVVSIVERTVAAAVARRGDLVTAGVLATDGTVAAGVYQGVLARAGVEALVPDPAGQAAVTEIIYGGVKAGLPVDPARLREAVEDLLSRGAQLVLLGCTELSVVAASCGMLDDARVVDSLDSLVRATITRSGHRVRAGSAPRP